MRLAPVVATAALAAGTVVSGAAPASAALVTRCVGEAGAVTVPGDLVVPAGESCTLDGTTVNGTVHVREGADLIVTNGTFGSRVVVQSDGYLDATGTSFADGITSRGGYGTYLESSTVTGSYVERGSEAVPFLFTTSASISGRLTVTNAAVVLESSSVEGAVNASDGDYTDVYDSTLERALSVQGMDFGSVVCESEVYGDANISGNATGVQIGGSGALGECDGPTFFGGDLTVSDNTGGVQVSDTIIRGDLAGEGNDPAPTGSDNRVRGDVSGQFVDLQPSPEVSAMARMAAPQDHQAQLQAERAQRLATATAEAAKAGAARF